MWKEFTQGYSISDDGMVRNDKTSHILKPEITRKGYYKLLIRNKHYYNHRLVAIYYVSNPDNKPQVNHIDYNKLNNHYSNLEWMTNQENTTHSYTKGRISGRTKLTIDQVKEILSLLSIPGTKPKHLAIKYNVSLPCIYAVKNGLNQKRLSLE